MTVTIRDVAARAGVSIGTVSNVLNGRASVKTDVAGRVRDAISELGYVRNDAARQLRAGRSRGIGLVVPDIANPFFAAVARGAESRAAEDGLVVLLGSSEHDRGREDAYLDMFREQRLNGVLVSPASGDIGSLRGLAASGVPIALVDRETDGSGFASVAVDDVEGGEIATRHLLERGRRRIAFVGGPLSTPQVADRLAGAERAVAAVDGARLEVIERPGLTVLDGRAAGEALRVRPAAERPDAVFAANDLLAVGVLQAFALLADVAVPDDIALVGYDDIDFAAAAIVPLTSVRQPAELIGWTAADLVLRQSGEALDATASVVRFRPELVVRASSGG
jgi:LacI family transcriptional regulator